MIYNINPKIDYFTTLSVALKSHTYDNCACLYTEQTNNNILKELYNNYKSNEFLYLRTKVKDVLKYQDIFYKKYLNLKNNDVVEFKVKIINPLEKHTINVCDDNYENMSEVEIAGYDIYEKMFITNIEDYLRNKVIIVQIHDVIYINEHFKLKNIFSNIYLFLNKIIDFFIPNQYSCSNDL